MFFESYEEVKDRVSDLNWEKLVCLIVCIALCIVVGVHVMADVDTTPASFEDYASLNETLLEIEKNPAIIMQINGVIQVSDEEITITIENDECKLTGHFTKDYQLVKRTSEDKAKSFRSELMGLIVVLFLLGALAFFAMMLSVYLIWFIVLIIVKSFKRFFPPKQEA